jgi:hypothetical protein
VSTPAARHLAARVGAISRHCPDDPGLPGLRHRLAVERADAALGKLSQRLLTEDERWRLHSRINGIPPSPDPVTVRPPAPPASPSQLRSAART